MRRCITIAVTLGALAGITAPTASAAAKNCGTAKGASNGATVTKVTTTSGTCTAAKTVAKKFAGSRVAPRGYACKESFTGPTKASVKCTRPGRKITFKVAWTFSMPLPPAQQLPG